MFFSLNQVLCLALLLTQTLAVPAVDIEARDPAFKIGSGSKNTKAVAVPKVTKTAAPVVQPKTTAPVVAKTTALVKPTDKATPIKSAAATPLTKSAAAAASSNVPTTLSKVTKSASASNTVSSSIAPASSSAAACALGKRADKAGASTACNPLTAPRKWPANVDVQCNKPTRDMDDIYDAFTRAMDVAKMAATTSKDSTAMAKAEIKNVFDKLAPAGNPKGTQLAATFSLLSGAFTTHKFKLTCDNTLSLCKKGYYAYYNDASSTMNLCDKFFVHDAEFPLWSTMKTQTDLKYGNFVGQEHTLLHEFTHSKAMMAQLRPTREAKDYAYRRRSNDDRVDLAKGTLKIDTTSPVYGPFVKKEILADTTLKDGANYPAEYAYYNADNIAGIATAIYWSTTKQATITIG